MQDPSLFLFIFIEILHLMTHVILRRVQDIFYSVQKLYAESNYDFEDEGDFYDMYHRL